MNLLPTLIQYTNIILLLTNTTADRRKFIVWDINDGERPTEILSGLQITRIAVENQKKVFEHPIETGETITDFEVLEPKKARLQAYIAIDDTTTLTELEDVYTYGKKLRIRAENRIIDNMIIASQPAEITSDVYDKTLYSINFTQAQEVTPQYVAMPAAAKASNKSRVNSGIKQTKKTTGNQGKSAKQKSSWIYSAIYGGRT